MSDLSPASAGDDLRAMIAESLEKAEAAAEPAGETKAPEATPAPEKPERATGGRERGADGKFVAKEEGAEPPDEETEPPEAPEAPETEETEKSDEPELKFEEPAAAVPQHWSAADKEMIASLPKEHQAKVVDRYKAIEAGFTPKLQRLSQMEKEFSPVLEMFAPHAEGLRRNNQTMADVIKAWGGVERDMQQGGQTAAQRVAGIIKAYNIDPGAVAQVLMGEAPSQAAPAAPVIPPEFMRRVDAVEQRVMAREQAERAAREATVDQQIQAFISEKDPATGQLKYPFFSELENDMVLLAQTFQSQRMPIPDVATLYDRAVYANPETRSKLLAAQEAEAQRKAAAERKAKAVAAQRASASVAGSSGGGQTTASQRSGTRSLHEELEANYAELNG